MVGVGGRSQAGAWEKRVGSRKAGGRRREDGKQDSQAGWSQEKLRKILQHVFHYILQRQGNHNGEGVGSRSKRYGKREIQNPLCPHSHPHSMDHLIL